MATHKVLLLGAGKIGRTICHLLTSSGDYSVIVGDRNSSVIDEACKQGFGHVTGLQLDVSNIVDLQSAMDGCIAVVSALPYSSNAAVARAAHQAGVSYFDLTEDRETAEVSQDLGRRCRDGQVFVPQCGLAPGFIGIAAHHLTLDFDRLDEVRLRVGALPQFPTNEMKYNLSWSTEGLINSYINSCDAIHNHRRMEVLPLEGVERFTLDGVDYEAFHTSGGNGSLCETLSGRVRTLDYKTIRYPGHRDRMAFLMHELQLGDDRALLKQIIERAVPTTRQDVVVIVCTVTGYRDGAYTHRTNARKIYHRTLNGLHWTAIEITTAAGLCAVLDLHLNGGLKLNGFIKQEQVPFDMFIHNRFGKMYEPMSEQTANVTPITT